MVTIPPIPSIPPIPKNITCKFGYYPIVVFASKGGKPLSGATVKFESWTLKIGKIALKQPATRTTNAAGIAHACFLFLSYGKVSIYHPNEDFGAGKGKWKTLGNIRSLRKPTSFAAIVRSPPLPIYKPPVPILPVIPVPSPPTIPLLPTLPTIPTPGIPTPGIPKPPVTPTPGIPTPGIPKPPEVPAGLPIGRIGSTVRLTMKDYIDDKPTLIGGAYWGARGASDTSAKIAQVTPTKQTIELQRSIDIGETRKFKSGFSVKVIRTRGGYPDAYADVIITLTPGIPKPPVTPTPPIPAPIIPKPPVTPTPPIPPVIEKTYMRITKILSYGQDLPKANNGEIVKITAESYSKVNGKIDKSKVPSLLIVDGVVADRKPVVDGVVAYEWTATSIPSRHTICVQINPTDTCRSMGRDCKKISVSSETLDSSEQLLRERTSAREQREIIRQSRIRLREEIIGAIREPPMYEVPTPMPTPMPSPTPISTPMPSPIPIPTPTTPTVPITVPNAEKTGSIRLTGIPLSMPDNVPVYIYIDNISKGKITNIPMTLTLINAGTHTVRVESIGFDVGQRVKSITKSIVVNAGKTTKVSLL